MRQLKNEKGITLVELLATIVILAIVVVFMNSIFQATIKQNEEQQTSAKQLTDVTFALKSITKDFRRSSRFEINNETFDELTLIQPSGDKVIYKKDGNQLFKNSEVITNNLGCFYVNKKNDELQLKISTNIYITDCTKTHDDIKETTLQIRKGDI